MWTKFRLNPNATQEFYLPQPLSQTYFRNVVFRQTHIDDSRGGKHFNEYKYFNKSKQFVLQLPCSALRYVTTLLPQAVKR